MVDYKIIEGDPEKFRARLLALYAERQEAQDMALASIAAGMLRSPGYAAAENRIRELSEEIAEFVTRSAPDWMA